MRSSVSAVLSVAALTSSLLACPAAAPVEATVVAAKPSPAATPVPASTPAPTARAARTGERPAARALTAADSAALGEYRAAMQVGRTRTRAKAYADAIAAFDRALVQRPGDARALAERGYARLLAKDLAGASEDLELARQRTREPARLGPIWFNVGLVAEASGNREGALRAFTLSNELHPTRAAAARLGGAAVCTAEIDRTPKAGTSFAGWKALYEHLIRDTEEPGLTSEAELRAALCFDPKQDALGLWDLCFYNAAAINHNSHASLLVGRAADEALVLFDELGFAEGGSCQPYGELTVTPVGDVVHARYVEFVNDWKLVPKDRGADAKICEVDGEDAPAGCELDCIAASARVDDYILDLRHKQRLARVRRTTNSVATEDPGALVASLAIQVSVGATGVQVEGGGCDEAVPILAPGP